jgi:hypothetical protein
LNFSWGELYQRDSSAFTCNGYNSHVRMRCNSVCLLLCLKGWYKLRSRWIK